MEESIAMARALFAAGYRTVYCTPHLIKGNFETDSGEVKGVMALLQEKLLREGVELDLLPGREYYLDEFLSDYLQDPLTMGESRLLLVEIPSHTPVEFVKESCYRIRCNGYIPLIAHPERCKLLDPQQTNESMHGLFGSLFNSKPKKRNPELLEYLQEIGCRFQGNIGSFAGYYGERVRASAERFRQMGLYSCFGTDGHSLEGVGAVLGAQHRINYRN